MKRTSFLFLATLPVLAAWGCSDGPQSTRRAQAEAPSPAPQVQSVYGIDEVVPASMVTEEASEPVLLPSARDTVSDLDSTTPETVGDPLTAGVRLFEERRYLESATQLSVAAREEPDAWYTHYLLGLALWKSGELDGAIDSLRRSAEIKDDFVKTHVNLARVLNAAGRPGEGLEAARAAEALVSADPVVLYLSGRSLANLGRHEEALAALGASLELDPENGDVHNRIGLVRIHQGRFQDAVLSLERAVELLPDRDYVRNNLGIAYEGIGRMRDAETQFAAGLESGGDSDKLTGNLARVRQLPDAAVVQVADGETADAPVPVDVGDEADPSAAPAVQLANNEESSPDGE